jgi:hypothetical protein
VGDTEFWDWLYAWMGDQANLKAVYDHLKSIDLSAVTNMQALFRTHVTPVAQRAAMATASPLTQWAVFKVQETLAQDPVPDITRITSRGLYSDFERWGKETRKWKGGELPCYDYNKFTQLLGEQYAGNGKTALVSIKLGANRALRGYAINWAAWHAELVKHKYMSPAGVDDAGELYDGNDYEDCKWARDADEEDPEDKERY